MNIAIIMIIIRTIFFRWFPSGMPMHIANADQIKTTAGIKTMIKVDPIIPYHLRQVKLSRRSVFCKKKVKNKTEIVPRNFHEIFNRTIPEIDPKIVLKTFPEQGRHGWQGPQGLGLAQILSFNTLL